MIDLLDLPFNVIHYLYKNSLLAALAQKKKEEEEQKQREEEEKRNRQQAARDQRMMNRKGPIQSSIPIKQSQQPIQMPSASSADVARLNSAAMNELEDMFEGGL